MKQSQAWIGSGERVTLKVEMLKRGLDYKDLAKLAGLSPRIVANVLCGNNRTWPPREAINQGLGVEVFARPERRAQRRAKIR